MSMLSLLIQMFIGRTSKYTASIAKSQLASFNDKLILVDRNDVQIGSITKEHGHQMKTIKQGKIHRAFSVFLFDSQFRLLMQQRSQQKITFPLYWTNSCCSHQLDIDEHKGLAGSERSARDRVKLELNLIIPQQVVMHLVQKIIYVGQYDQIWGEYELDYVYFAQLNNQDLSKINVNPEEVTNIELVERKTLPKFIESKTLITPWFQKIASYKLDECWQTFERGKIHELTKDVDKIISFD